MREVLSFLNNLIKYTMYRYLESNNLSIFKILFPVLTLSAGECQLFQVLQKKLTVCHKDFKYAYDLNQKLLLEVGPKEVSTNTNRGRMFTILLFIVGKN